MKVYIDYPFEASFETDEKLPKFKYGCNKRTALLHQWLTELEAKGKSYPHHSVEDFIVEKVIKKADSEDWIVGS